MIRYLGLFISLWVLVGCEAQATPIAAVSSVATVEPQFVDVTQPPPMRYGIADHTLPYVTDIGQIREFALVESMPPNPDLTTYDVALAYGIYEGWQQAPISHTVSLIINAQLAPLNNIDIQTLLRQSLNTQAIIDSTGISGLIAAASERLSAAQIRNTLANLGYPDGFRLTVAIEPLPATQTVIQQLTAINLDIVTTEIESLAEAEDILANNRAHVLLIRWQNESERSQWVARVGENFIIDLYTLPISYVARDSITISFTENGWAIADR
ncbi:MAG: hypothetical protein Q9P01_02530 [Anaerolineae bacterium]|nr:hypothetical protein [Anaerolineae bacterium]MDQ7033733.1 hypothetical protein [Anaerolineae bacterium]